jgi:hypothetical protein
MLDTISAEIIYCRARARLAREKGDTATSAEEKNDYVAAEARWLVLMRSYELQDRLSKTLSERESSQGPVGGARERAYALDPEVVAILSSAFHAVFAERVLSDSDKIMFALWVGRRIIELAARGERDPDRFKAAIRAWATK